MPCSGVRLRDVVGTLKISRFHLFKMDLKCNNEKASTDGGRERRDCRGEL